jgi:Zn-finger protein
MTDISTQAVEAEIERHGICDDFPCHQSADHCRDCRKAFATREILRALAAERDELVKAAIMQKATYEGVSSMLLSVQKDYIDALAEMRTALEPFAKLAGPLVDDGADVAIGLREEHFIAAREAYGRIK